MYLGAVNTSFSMGKRSEREEGGKMLPGIEIRYLLLPLPPPPGYFSGPPTHPHTASTFFSLFCEMPRCRKRSFFSSERRERERGKNNGRFSPPPLSPTFRYLSPPCPSPFLLHFLLLLFVTDAAPCKKMIATLSLNRVYLLQNETRVLGILVHGKNKTPFVAETLIFAQ